jgi:ribosomal protein L35
MSDQWCARKCEEVGIVTTRSNQLRQIFDNDNIHCMAAYKAKSKSALMKRIVFNAAGVARRGGVKRRHNLRRRTEDAKRQSKRLIPLSSAHKRILKIFTLPK